MIQRTVCQQIAVSFQTYMMTFFDASSDAIGSHLASVAASPPITCSSCSWSLIAAAVDGGRRQNSGSRQKHKFRFSTPRPNSNIITRVCKHSDYWYHWRRGSVVRTSVCSRRTFPDLRLIHGWHVTTSCVRRPLWVNQRGQLSLPSLWVGKWIVTNATLMNYEGGDHWTAD